MRLDRWGALAGALLLLPALALAQARPPAQKTGPLAIYGSGSTGDVSAMSVTSGAGTFTLQQILDTTGTLLPKINPTFTGTLTGPSLNLTGPLSVSSVSLTGSGSTGDVSGTSVTRQGVTSPLSVALSIGGGSTSVSTTGGTLALTPAVLANRVIVITGTLASASTVTFPAAIGGQWTLINSTSGSFGMAAQVVGQSASALNVPSGQPRSVSSDGATLTSPVSQANALTSPTTTVTGNFVGWGGTNGQTLTDAGFAIGTTGHAVPLLDGANTWSASQRILSSSNPGITIGLPFGQQYLDGYNTGANIFGLYDVTGGRFRYACLDASLNCGVNTTAPGAVWDVAGTLRGQMLVLSGAPTASTLPASYWTVVKRTDDGSVKICANDGGTVKCAAMQ